MKAAYFLSMMAVVLVVVWESHRKADEQSAAVREHAYMCGQLRGMSYVVKKLGGVAPPISPDAHCEAFDDLEPGKS